MSQSTKITLRDIDKNILQLNRKNMPDNIVYSQQLSGYAKKEDIEETPTIPTKLSQLQNDEGYIKDYTQTDPIYTADKSNIALKNEIPTKVSDLQNDEGYIKSFTQTDPIYTADKANIALKSELPTKLSDLQNDEGYIKDYTQTDPIYMADKANIALKSEVPTKVSELQNDSNFISDYIETDPIYTADKPNIALKSEIPTKLSDLQNDEGYIDGYTETDPIYTADKPNIALKSEIPTDLSAFTDTSNIILNVKNNAITEANSYTDQEKVKYLPLAGGAMTGYEIKRNVTNSYIIIRGGTSLTTGATFVAYGSTSDYPGVFQISAHDGTKSSYFQGYPDGRLLWCNNPVTALPAGTVAGTLYVGATRQFTTIAAALNHIRKSSNGLDKVWNILLDPGEHAISGTITGLWLNIAPVSGSYSTDCSIIGNVTMEECRVKFSNLHFKVPAGSGSVLIASLFSHLDAVNCVFDCTANTNVYFNAVYISDVSRGSLTNCTFYAGSVATQTYARAISLSYLGINGASFIGTGTGIAVRALYGSVVILTGTASTVSDMSRAVLAENRSFILTSGGTKFTATNVTTYASPALNTVGNNQSFIN